MNSLLFKLFVVILINGIPIKTIAQIPAETTIILLRHAEKDTIDPDPGLSVAGKARAEKLLKIFKKVNVNAMYSTPYKRTTETLKPWAKKSDLKIKMYDPRNLKAFADELKLMKGKTIVVVGHSNTTPALVNLLLGKEKYKSLDDTVYIKIWVVTIKKGGTITDKIIEY